MSIQCLIYTLIENPLSQTNFRQEIKVSDFKGKGKAVVVQSIEDEFDYGFGSSRLDSFGGDDTRYEQMQLPTFINCNDRPCRHGYDMVGSSNGVRLTYSCETLSRVSTRVRDTEQVRTPYYVYVYHPSRRCIV